MYPRFPSNPFEDVYRWTAVLLLCYSLRGQERTRGLLISFDEGFWREGQFRVCWKESVEWLVLISVSSVNGRVC